VRFKSTGRKVALQELLHSGATGSLRSRCSTGSSLALSTGSRSFILRVLRVVAGVLSSYELLYRVVHVELGSYRWLSVR
jgi:hypothetical protein